MDVWQGERPFILHFFLNSFNENFTASKRRLFFTLLDLEKALIRCQGKLFALF